MYNEKLAIALLQRLDEQFPDVMQFKNLYDFLLPRFPNVPQEEWLKSFDALLQTEMIKGVPLRDGASLIALANIMISPNGRNELRKPRVAEQRTAEGNGEAMSRDELLKGQRWVEDIVARLLAERGMRLDAPIKWTANINREICTMEARMGGTTKLWNLSYEALEDCVADKNVRRAIEKSLRMYFIPDSQGRTGVEPEEIRAPAIPILDASLPAQTDDRKFSRLAIEEARKSVPEDDRVHPRVGVVVVKDGHILASAHRGEIPQCHAEYIALEKKLTDVSLSGATVYTTLEPCTARKHPKVPCASRLAERKVARVVIGMLDPDDRISGRGQRALRKAGIATVLFPHDLMAEVEELNRDFVRDRESRENDLGDSLSTSTSLPSPVRPSATPKLRVALERGHVSNFVLRYTNDDDESIFIREVRLFAGRDGKIELTEPLTPDDPSTWRVAPRTSMSFGKTIVHQRNPAASLVKMNSNAGIFFETEMDVVVSCEMKGQRFEIRQALYVKVNGTSNEIVPLV